MQIDVFNEIQNPKPWHGDHEHRRITQALAQAKLAEAVRNGAAAAAAWYTVRALTFFEAKQAFLENVARQQAMLAAPDGGGLTHEAVLKSIRLVGSLIPEFA